MWSSEVQDKARRDGVADPRRQRHARLQLHADRRHAGRAAAAAAHGRLQLMQERDLQALALLLLLACTCKARQQVGDVLENQHVVLANHIMHMAERYRRCDRRQLATVSLAKLLPMQAVLWAKCNCLGQVWASQQNPVSRIRWRQTVGRTGPVSFGVSVADV